MTDRDREVLGHVGLYRLSLRPTLSRLFFGGHDPSSVLQRLRGQGLLQERTDGLPGRISYYQLTDGAAARLGLPLKRAAPLGERALLTHLAVLWFATMDGIPRTRVEPRALESLFGEASPATPQSVHCLEDVEGRRRIYRVFVPGRRSTIGALLKSIRSEIAVAKEAGGELASWLQARVYGFAVLVETPEWQTALQEALRRSDILSEAHVAVSLAPSPETLLRALADYRAKAHG